MIINSIIYETCIDENLSFFNEDSSFNLIEMIKKVFNRIREKINRAIRFIKNKLKKNTTSKEKKTNRSNSNDIKNDTNREDNTIDDEENDENQKLSKHDILSLIHYSRMNYYIENFSKSINESFKKFEDVFYGKSEYNPKQWFADIQSMFRKIDEINNSKWKFDIDYKNDSIKFISKNTNLSYTITKDNISQDLIKSLRKLTNILHNTESNIRNTINQDNDLKIRNFRLVRSYLSIIQAVYGKTLSTIQEYYDGRNIYNDIFYK